MKLISGEQKEGLRSSTKILQVVTVAMFSGCLMFGVAVFGIAPAEDINNELKMLVALGVMTGVVVFAMSYIVGAVMFESRPASVPPTEQEIKKAVGNLQSTHVIRCALIEGGIFLNLVVFLLDHSMLSIYIAGLGAALLCLMLPTHGRVIRAVENRLE